MSALIAATFFGVYTAPAARRRPAKLKLAKTLKNIFEALTGLNGLIMGLKFRTISPLQLLYIEGFQKIEYLMRYHPWL